jgi:hypothetical protein
MLSDSKFHAMEAYILHGLALAIAAFRMSLSSRQVLGNNVMSQRRRLFLFLSLYTAPVVPTAVACCATLRCIAVTGWDFGISHSNYRGGDHHTAGSDADG